MDNVEVFVAGTMAGLALLLAAVAAASYARSRSRRALVLGVAFLVMAAKGALLLVGIVTQDLAASGLDLAVIALLYAGLLSG